MALSYLNKIYPDCQPTTHVRYQGQMLTHDEFAAVVDNDRLQIFLQEEKERVILCFDSFST